MSITLRFGNLRIDGLAFAYSPGQEAIHSLHILCDARSHPLHVPWVVQARKRLSPGLKAELDRFQFIFQGRMPIFWDVRASHALCTIDDDLQTLRQMPGAEFIHGLLLATGAVTPAEPAPADSAHPPSSPCTHATDLTGLCAEAAGHYPDAAPVLSAAAADPDQERNRFCQFLRHYWDACLAHQWDHIEEMFVSDIERRGRLLVRRGIAAALDGLSTDMRIDAATSTCHIIRPGSTDLSLTEHDSLTLIPSYFAWPHLFMNLYPPDVLIAYPVLEQQQEGRAPVPPDRLLKLLRAAGDTSRLQILQLIGIRPRSTGELAGLIGISEAAVSKHLKQLQEAGLAVAERQSYYVFYRAAREPVAELTRGLDALLAGQG